MLLSSAYLPPVWYFAKLFACDGKEVQVECWDHYVKQTYRNRCHIMAADGMMSLTVPVDKGAEAKCCVKDVRISDHGNWRHQHWNALETAYAGTPFFLYYEDDFRPFYERRFEFLYDFNLQLTELCCDLIDIHPRLLSTAEYSMGERDDDFRDVIHPKHDIAVDASFTPAPYWQVFGDRFGFTPNLSVVDLLFNMGPESILVLQKSVTPCE